jgi:CheY-like chemotaxis protein/anti-sigma regulatory factor (Ser/Thr protein kinase)
VLGDPERLRQVIGNLLSNAVKFTPKGGSVLLSFETNAGQVEIAVCDTGVGIAPEFLPHLFERFRQADSGTTRTQGGLGIGLAIARQLIELHGGSIHAESEGAGRGATFRLRLPLASETLARPKDEAGHADAEVGLDGVRILLVEDEPDTRECLMLMLEKQGAAVEAVASAREALEALDRGPPQVLLSDLAMPDEDGLSLIRRVRSRPAAAGGRIPAAALSAYARPEERARAILAGFDLHVAKPVDPLVLAEAIRRLTDRADRG